MIYLIQYRYNKYMLVVFLLLLNINNVFTFHYYDDIDRENYIENTCNFNIIRLNYNDVLCNDYGRYKKYCLYDYLPDEFIIKKEIGVGKY